MPVGNRLLPAPTHYGSPPWTRRESRGHRPRRGGSNGRKKAKSVAGSQRLALPQWRCATAVAARHIPLAEERSFPAIFPFATETGLRLVTLVVKQQLQGKEEVESHWWFRVKAWS
jgi:hypothetical protein